MVHHLVGLAERVVIEVDLSPELLHDDVLLEVSGEDTVVGEELGAAQMLLYLQAPFEDLLEDAVELAHDVHVSWHSHVELVVVLRDHDALVGNVLEGDAQGALVVVQVVVERHVQVHQLRDLVMLEAWVVLFADGICVVLVAEGVITCLAGERAAIFLRFE